MRDRILRTYTLQYDYRDFPTQTYQLSFIAGFWVVTRSNGKKIFRPFISISRAGTWTYRDARRTFAEMADLEEGDLE